MIKMKMMINNSNKEEMENLEGKNNNRKADNEINYLLIQTIYQKIILFIFQIIKNGNTLIYHFHRVRKTRRKRETTTTATFVNNKARKNKRQSKRKKNREIEHR